jgi:hypothetical protein
VPYGVAISGESALSGYTPEAASPDLRKIHLILVREKTASGKPIPEQRMNLTDFFG